MKKVTAQEVHAAFTQAIEQTPGSEQFYTLKPWDEMSESEQANMAEMAWKLNLVASEMEVKHICPHCEIAELEKGCEMCADCWLGFYAFE